MDKIEKIRQESEELYARIDRCIDTLIKARLNKDTDCEGKSLFQMEGLMVGTQQFLCWILDTLSEEPVSEELEEAAKEYADKHGFKVGEIVAVSQPYKDVFTNGLVNPFVAKAGWTNKMFVRADLMPYQIRITNIHIERLQEISDKDCMREGIYVSKTEPFVPNGYSPYCANDPKEPKEWFHTPREAFAALIDKVSGRGTWESNPWVFVCQFELVE